ncbi:MAG TPA: TolC family protein [Kofleriaceae bacterium]|nr:TolC family protein [Kofleriaceae bacterium]
MTAVVRGAAAIRTAAALGAFDAVGPVILVAVASVVAPSLAAAEPAAPATEASDEVTADQAVALYRERSPRLAASRAAIDVTAADLVDAAIYPNPTLSLDTTNIVQGQDTFGHSQELAGIDVPILIGGQRGHRARAAEARIAARRAELQVDQARAEIEIRRRFLSLLAAQQRAAALATALDDATAVRAIVAGRQQAGAKSPYELERTELALAAIASKRDEAGTGITAAAGALAAAVGIPGWLPRAAGGFEPPAPASSAGPAAEHPALLAGVAAAAAARQDQAAARAEAVPTPSLQLQGLATTDPQGIALTVGISLPLPVFDRNQGAIARARAQQRAAELEHRAAGVELAADLARAAAVEAARCDAVARFRAGAIERLPRVRAMAEASYRSGQGGIVELLDALDAITEARLRDIELVASALDAELDVRAAARGR